MFIGVICIKSSSKDADHLFLNCQLAKHKWWQSFEMVQDKNGRTPSTENEALFSWNYKRLKDRRWDAK